MGELGEFHEKGYCLEGGGGDWNYWLLASRVAVVAVVASLQRNSDLVISGKFAERYYLGRYWDGNNYSGC